MNRLKTEVKKSLERLYKNCDRPLLVLAFSGGVDSVCLLHCLVELKKEMQFDLIAAHVNHSLREEADSDERFCEALASSWGVKFCSQKFDIKDFSQKNGYSIEEGGRIKRYEFLQGLAADGYLLTAHHRDDNLETILLNLFRGSGAEGVKGIEAFRENIVRPMLSCSKKEIMEYALGNKLEWVEDKTNHQDAYARNNLRINVIPYLKQNMGEDIEDKLLRFSKLITEDNEFIKAEAEKYMDLPVEEFNRLHYALRTRIVRKKFFDAAGSLDGLSKKHVDMVLEMCEKGVTGKRIEVPGDFVFELVYGKLVVSSKYKQNVKYGKLDIEIPMSKKYNEYVVEVSEVSSKQKTNDRDSIYIDNSYTGLCIRTRQEGDFIRLNRNGLSRSIKKLFIDRKIERDKRDAILLVAFENEILWAYGVEKGKAASQHMTDKLICIKIYKDNGGRNYE